jgi:hypothetical protein
LKKSAVLSFAFVAIEIDGKISQEVCSGTSGCYFFKKQ